MPLFIGYISLQFASGLSLYWLVYNLVTMVISYVLLRDTMPPLTSYLPASLRAYLPAGSPTQPLPNERNPEPLVKADEIRKEIRKPASRQRKKRRR